MKKHTRRLLGVALAAVCGLSLCFAATGCSSSSTSSSEPAQKALEGQTLSIYCGAGMTEPFKEIAQTFQDETGCTVEVTYANAAQIQTQINTTQEGDFFIAGSGDEVKPVEQYVKSSVDLVKHIPVLIVPASNPKNVTGIADLVNCDTILIGDPESTPIGKIAKNVLTKNEIWDAVQDKLTTTTTAPQIASALAKGEGDAGIVWKENVQGDVTIIECAPMQNAIKTIPAVELTCGKNTEAAAQFSEFLQTDTAKNIWTKYGYELV